MRRRSRDLRRAPARDWRDPAIALAAREHQQRAQVQVAQLRRKGIVVLDEPDDKLDRAVLDAYLQLRQRGASESARRYGLPRDRPKTYPRSSEIMNSQ